MLRNVAGATLLAAALVAAPVSQASAHDHGAEIGLGLLGAAAIVGTAAAMANGPYYAAPAPVYEVPPPVVYAAPPPTVVYAQPYPYGYAYGYPDYYHPHHWHHEGWERGYYRR